MRKKVDALSFFRMELNREHLRAIIYYEWLDVKDSREIHERITRRLGQGHVSKSMVEYWVREFRSGRETLEDEDRSGRPSTSTTDENIAGVRELIHANPRITFIELESHTMISRGSLQRILHDHLKVHKVMSRFIPHKLTPAQKMARVDICKENLKLWKSYGARVVDRIITGDETYVHYYDAPTRSESKVWIFEDETPPEVVKRGRTVGKVLYAVFFRCSGLVQAIKLEGQKSVTALWYTTQCLPKVFQDAGKKGLLLLHDNASSHTAKVTMKFLQENHIKTIPHPAYSPDLAMCDFWLFSGLKRELRGRSFASEEELDTAVFDYFNSIPESGWREAFNMWKTRMERCIEVEGEYFEH
jgi:histone-lysine N-methyltransferase SETMAR